MAVCEQEVASASSTLGQGSSEEKEAANEDRRRHDGKVCTGVVPFLTRSRGWWSLLETLVFLVAVYLADVVPVVSMVASCYRPGRRT